MKKTSKRQQYTAEEKKAYFAQQKKDIEQLLLNGVAHCYTEGNFKNYLDTICKFHSYSLNNCLLIALQMPTATYVAGLNDWNKKFNRRVIAGQKAIKILAPIKYKFTKEQVNADGDTEQVDIEFMRFKVVNVFDVSQTDGKELPTICNELQGEVMDYDELLKKIIAIANVPVTFEPIDNGANGYYNRIAKCIVIKEDMAQAQTIKTLVHEIAHSILHDDAFCNIPREVKEIQAESVAYMVCKELGINTDDYSFEYVASWAQQDMKTLTAQMDICRKTADAITSKIRA